MRDKDLYAKILGIESPWRVDDVELADEEVRVHLSNAQTKLPCPECGEACKRYDSRHRRWRHLDTCQYRTILVADVPRISCAEHGVKQITVPWAEPGSGFTALFEALVIDWLLEAHTSAVARLFGLPWSSVDTIQQRAVRRGLARRKERLPVHMGVDETSFQKRHEYVTVVSDQDEGVVVHVADGRGRDALDDYFTRFRAEELELVETVAMDMWGAYIASVEDVVPDAEKKIVFDKFHIAKHLGDAVNKMRRSENKQLLIDGDRRLVSTRYVWLQNPDRMRWETQRTLEQLRSTSLKTARAWAIKEFAMCLWHYRSRGWARKAWLRWYSWAIRSRLEPIKAVARMIKRHLDGVVSAVVTGVTNAAAEGINATIQKLKANARGYRNRERFRNAIYFHLGGLDLYPESVRS
jgi:transposase